MNDDEIDIQKCHEIAERLFARSMAKLLAATEKKPKPEDAKAEPVLRIRPPHRFG